MLVKVHVTKEDITQGNHRDSQDCMVQRAISRLLADGREALVGIHDATIIGNKLFPAFFLVKFPPEVGPKILKGIMAQRSDKTQKWFHRLPEPLRQFFSGKMTKECLPEPFEFEIDIPAECLKIMPNFPDINLATPQKELVTV